jgi:hypothetical protein
MKTIKVKDLMAISGKSGLFRFLAQARNGVIVESLEDKKRAAVPPTARVLALEDISIFCENEDLPLADVFHLIYKKEEGKEALDPKSDAEKLKVYMKEILPEYDEERVYVSDIKKVLAWYQILHNLNLLEEVDKEEEDDNKDKDDKGAAEKATKKDKPANEEKE